MFDPRNRCFKLSEQDDFVETEAVKDEPDKILKEFDEPSNLSKFGTDISELLDMDRLEDVSRALSEIELVLDSIIDHAVHPKEHPKSPRTIALNPALAEFENDGGIHSSTENQRIEEIERITRTKANEWFKSTGCLSIRAQALKHNQGPTMYDLLPNLQEYQISSDNGTESCRDPKPEPED